MVAETCARWCRGGGRGGVYGPGDDPLRILGGDRCWKRGLGEASRSRVSCRDVDMLRAHLEREGAGRMG